MRLLLLVAGLVAATGKSPGTVDYAWRPINALDRNAPAALRFAQARPAAGRTIGVGAFAPETVVRLTAGIEFSLDGGLHWRPAPSSHPAKGDGEIAVSADGRVWVYGGTDATYRTEDYGFVWTVCEGLPAGAYVVADRTSPSLFFALDLDGQGLLNSTDGAKTFRGSVVSLPESLHPKDSSKLFCTPGRSGDLWIAGTGGLYHSPPARSFSKLPGVTKVQAFCFGLGTPGSEGATLFVAGTVEGESGIFRSEDEGRSWLRLGGTPPWGRVLELEPDRKKPGRLYVRSVGGLNMGDPR